MLLLDDDFDGSVDLGSLINTIGAGRTAPSRTNEYRRRRRKSEDSYDELDFA
ncbi:hypothetical protein [Bradyrhizobium diazoefficiens]|uniref:hypothetical protein n=1 Tax=Bradyrhizobium diazoefficiens TaxID=1355477 RepID=UPI003517FC6F